MLSRIDAVLFDPDGVLIEPDKRPAAANRRSGRLCSTDEQGIALALKAGLKVVVLLNSRNSAAHRAQLERLGAIQFVLCDDRAVAVSLVNQCTGLSPKRMAYIGSCIEDLRAMKAVGFAAAVAG